jgi:hypothetical protein
MKRKTKRRRMQREDKTKIEIEMKKREDKNTYKNTYKSNKGKMRDHDKHNKRQVSSIRCVMNYTLGGSLHNARC